MLLVIGLDGASYHFLEKHLRDLPVLNYLRNRYGLHPLECDVRPMHSGPSWATVFTGLMPGEHGITDFVEGPLPTVLPWLWRDVPGAVVVGLPVTIPPTFVGSRLDDWIAAVLAITSQEMLQSTDTFLNLTVEAAVNEPPLLISVFPALDRAGHILWDDQAAVLEQHQAVDEALGGLLPYLEDNTFVILSDHGMTDRAAAQAQGWSKPDERIAKQAGDHDPYGILLSNGPGPLPGKVGQVYPFLRRLLS